MDRILQDRQAARTAMLRLGLAVLLALAAPQPGAGLAQAAAAEGGEGIADADFQKGVTYVSWAQSELPSPDAAASLTALAATGASWVAIVVTGYQTDVDATEVRRDRANTATDADLVHAIEAAHDLDLRVMLKPHVDLSDEPDPTMWRGKIGSGFTEERQWQAWFAAYRGFIEHYAELAETLGVEQLSVGTELVATSHREADWRRVVEGVRARFSGALTYAANHSGEETAITWWDALDYIGVDAYYPLAEHPTADEAELRAAWSERGYLATLAELAERFERPVLLTEIGYRSVDGATIAPWAWRGRPTTAGTNMTDRVQGDADGAEADLPATAPTVDLAEQAAAYRASLEALWPQPWLAGLYWWYWDPDPAAGGPADTAYTPQGKPAETALESYYRRQRVLR